MMNQPKNEGDTYCQQLMKTINQAHAFLDRANQGGEWRTTDLNYRKYIQDEALHLLVRICNFNTWEEND